MKKICQPTGKVIYKRHQSAARVVALLTREYAGVASCPQSIYQCEHCNRWHLTSYTPEETRNLQRARRRKGAKKK